MSIIKTPKTNINPNRNRNGSVEPLTVTAIEPVKRLADAMTVVEADKTSDDGRSQFFWMRLNNDDLILAVYPQGQTYHDTSLRRTV